MGVEVEDDQMVAKWSSPACFLRSGGVVFNGRDVGHGGVAKGAMATGVKHGDGGALSGELGEGARG